MSDKWTPEWPEDVVVTVNGKEYRTNLFDGVQRFIPDPAVLELVNLSTRNFMGAAGGAFFYPEIPEELKSLTHPNPVVNYMVERNQHDYFGINELLVALHQEEFALEDFIEFETMHGWSVAGFENSVSQVVCNLGLAEEYEDPDDGEIYEDVSEHFTLHNPHWEK